MDCDQEDPPRTTPDSCIELEAFVLLQATSFAFDDPLEKVIESDARLGRAAVLVGTLVPRLHVLLDHGQGMLNCLHDLQKLLQTLAT